MPVKKITEEYFYDLKKTMRWTTNRRAANKHGVSLKTVLQVRGSKNYEEYTQQMKAQHPPTKYSAREDLVNYYKERCAAAGIEFKEPRSMQIALYKIRQMDA